MMLRHPNICTYLDLATILLVAHIQIGPEDQYVRVTS